MIVVWNGRVLNVEPMTNEEVIEAVRILSVWGQVIVIHNAQVKS